MGRGYDKEIYSVNRKNNEAGYVYEYWDMGELMPNPFPPPIPPKDKKELEKYLFGGRVFNKDKRKSVAAIRDFADGAIPPREAAFARHRDFYAEQSDTRLSWHDWVGKIDEKYRPFRIIPTQYVKRNREGKFWLDKEWTSKGRLSRIISEGPARVPVPLTEGTTSEASDHSPRYEWWFWGQPIGFYENGRYVDALSDQSLVGPEPNDDTPWPLESPFYNFISRASSIVTADIMIKVWKKNEQGEKVLLPALLEEMKKEYPHYSEKEINESMGRLLSYPLLKKGGMLSNKDGLRINKRFLKRRPERINYDAVERLNHEALKRGVYGADDLMVASFEAFWKDPSKKGLKKIITDVQKNLD